MDVAASGVDSIAVSILGASSATFVVFPLSGDFARPNLKPDVKRRPSPSFLGTSFVSVVGSSVVDSAAVSVGSEDSPFVSAETTLSLVSFFGMRPANIL